MTIINVITFFLRISCLVLGTTSLFLGCIYLIFYPQIFDILMIIVGIVLLALRERMDYE